MCGILGSINFNISPNNFKTALNSLNHRGPDDEGVFNIKLLNKNIYFGHKRLSIVDIKMGKQPMKSSVAENYIIFNGEIYNAPELRKTLLSKNYKFISENSDTEVLLNAYLEWGENLVNYLDGMWSFALFDKSKNKIFFSRDKFGEKPFFYYHENNQFVFASELIAFNHIQNLNLSLDRLNLKKYCAHGFFPSDNTPYKFIKKLEPGHNLTLNLQNMSVEKKKYWEYKITPNFEKSENYWKEKIYNAIEKSVKSRMLSDVPVGVFLSGGLDSSIISYFAKNFKNDLNTFSIEFDEKSFDETEHANKISQKIGSIHHKTKLSRANSQQELIEYFLKSNEPLSDSSLISFYKLNKFASKKVKVVLGGDAADELFGGYDTLKAIKIANFLNKTKFNKLHPIVNFFISKMNSDYSNMNLKFKLQRFFKFNYNKLSVANPMWLSPLSIDEIDEIFGDNNNIEEIYSESINLWDENNHLDLIDKSCEFYCKIFLQHQILVKADRLSMMHSLELRSPFLSNEIVDISMCLPNKFKIKNNISKFILKKTFENTLGYNFVNRKKIGLSTPLSKFIKSGDININLNSNFMNYRSKYIDSKIKEHNNNINENRIFLWNIMCLDHFLKDKILD